MSENVGRRAQPAGEGDFGPHVDQALLSFYAPASLVVTRQLRVVDRRGNLEPFKLPERFTKVPPGVLGDAIRRGIEAVAQNDSAHAEEVAGVARVNILPITAGSARKRLFVVILRTPGENATDRARDLETQLAGGPLLSGHRPRRLRIDHGGVALRL